MEGKKQMKLSLKAIIIIVSMLIILICIIGVGVYIKTKKKSNSSLEKQQKSVIEANEIDNNEVYNNLNKVCRIKGKGSDLLYKNEYESDTSYIEKVIYSDMNDKNNKINFLNGNSVIESVLKGKKLNGDFIKVKYDTDTSDFDDSIIYMMKRKFFGFKTKVIVKKAFDQNEKEVNLSLFDDINTIKSKSSIFYVLFDITNEEGKEYIVGMYNRFFEDNNSNVLQIAVILNKQNTQIDISDEEQTKKLWNQYANYEIEKTEESKNGDYEEVNINGETLYHRLTNNVWKGKYLKEGVVINRNLNKQEVVSYEDYIKYINIINSNAREKIKKQYTDQGLNYVILSYVDSTCGNDIELIDYKEGNNKIIIYGNRTSSMVVEMGTGYLIAIPTKKSVGTTVEYRECYSTSEISNLKNYGVLEYETMWD